MNNTLELVVMVAGFVIVTLAALKVGTVFALIGLPKITGYLATGLLAGPFLLGLIPLEAPEHLLFVDEFSLAFIAFAAGSELYLPELRGRLRSISLVTVGLVVFTFIFILSAVLMLADYIPFMQPMPQSSRLAVAVLAGAILVARSPSSAIAIVNELRAKGPFTQMALGVTVIMDVLVIVIFALSSAAADVLLAGSTISPTFVMLLLIDLLLAVGLGFGLYKVLDRILTLNLNRLPKTILLLLIGYGVFLLSSFVRSYIHEAWHIEILIEPLLVCLMASFLVNNYSSHRLQMADILHEVGPNIYVLFFTLTGASLELDLLLQVWPIALALFATRFLAIMVGSFLGGTIAGDPFSANRIKWMAFITQAGVALGLAKEAAVEFPLLGNNFSTLIIAVVVINETIGPLFFKRAIKLMDEAHTRGETAEFDGVRDALIFGVDGQAVVLGRQLESHGWQVKLVWPTEAQTDLAQSNGLEYHQVSEVNLQTLQNLEAAQADAMVMMLSDEENYKICQLAYEHFGTDLLVVLVQDRAYTTRFQQLGALIVDPSTAILSLLDHVVRAPSAASIFLGMDEAQDIIDLEMRDLTLDGVALRNIRLPLGTIILSIHRNGQLIMPHGYTRLQLGDRITVIGAPEHLEEVMLRFDARQCRDLNHPKRG